MFITYNEFDLLLEKWSEQPPSAAGAQELKVGTPFIGCLEGPSAFVITGIFNTWDEAKAFLDKQNMGIEG